MDDVHPRLMSETLISVYDFVAGVSGAIAPALDTYGITRMTAHLLWVVDPDEEPPSMLTVAERTHCTPQHVTFMCQQLESRALVQRRVSDEDQRQRVVELTARDREARTELDELVSRSSPLAGMDTRSLQLLVRLLTVPPW